jgi:hypothetical protein
MMITAFPNGRWNKKRGSAGILNRETPRTLETAIIKIQRFWKKIKSFS